MSTAENLRTDQDALIIERDELLKSIEDLNREHDAGDIDDIDYQTLLDSYTARTAEVLRALSNEPTPAARRKNAINASVPAAKVRPVWRKFATVGAIGVFAVVAGVFVARSAGERSATPG